MVLCCINYYFCVLYINSSRDYIVVETVVVIYCKKYGIIFYYCKQIVKLKKWHEVLDHIITLYLFLSCQFLLQL